MDNKKDNNKEKSNENVEATKKEEVVVKEENSNKKGLIVKIVIAVAIVLLIVVCGKFVYDKVKNKDDISGVRKLLKAKYADIECINLDCDGFIAIDGDKLTKYKVLLYNSEGKKVANYKVNYNSSDKTTEVPIDIADDFYISATVSVKNPLDISKYSIKNKRGKTVYETKNKLRIINDKVVEMDNGKSSTLLDKKGEKLYGDISDIDVYQNGKYIAIQINDEYYSILNYKGEKILDGYKISKIVTDEDDNEVFAIVRNVKDGVYNYYDLDKKKVVGDAFSSYDQNDDSLEFTITKKENDKSVKYTLKENGKQEKLDEDIDEFKDELDEKIDSKKYKLYTNGIYDSDQKYVFVDNISEKSFGILKIKDNKYTEIYKYKSNARYYNSSISKIRSKEDDSSYFKITCSKSSCDEGQTIIYDLEDTKNLYKVNSSISSYLQYEDGYKVIKFYSNDKYDSNYVVFDENNKELLVSENNVVIIDKDLVAGLEPSYSLSLYSVKKGKVLNKEKVSSTKVLEDVVYKYEDDNGNSIILNSKGEEKIKVKRDDYLELSGNSYIYISDNKLNIYNIEKDKTYKYRLKDNEKLNNAAGLVIKPYRNAIFINNSTDNYAKVIDFKGNQIKKLSRVQISSVNINKKEKKAYIIVKKVSDKGDSYGLYVAE